jgi:hypothetical protein
MHGCLRAIIEGYNSLLALIINENMFLKLGDPNALLDFAHKPDFKN